MPKVGLVGPYNQIMKDAFYQSVPKGFEVIEVESREDYGKLKEADYIINRTLEMNAEEIAACPNLRMIAKYAVGYDNLDLAAAGARNIPITNCKGFNSDSVAELTIALMLAVYRNLMPMYLGLRDNQWMQDQYVHLSHTLKGKRVGIIGLGSIGSRVARLATAFGAQVLYYDVARRSPEEEAELSVTFLPMDELLAGSDVVTLHCPGSAQNTHLIDRTALQKMKSSAILINCSRGPVVNEKDLYQALVDGTIRAAGIDVFEVEPPVDNPLLKLPNVAASPHVGGSTYGLGAGMVQLCMHLIAEFDAGNPLPLENVVNYKYLADPKIVEGCA